MKNIQIIDNATNATFSIFQAHDDEFLLIFPQVEQDIQFAEDLRSLPEQEKIANALRSIWGRPIRKRDANGIHGTLFYGLQRYKSIYYENREDCVDPAAINESQRKLFRNGK